MTPATAGGKRRVLLSWSSGKDSAWCLYQLQQEPDVDVVGLLTTFNLDADRVAMHGVRRELVEAQADRAGLPLVAVELQWPSSNADYEDALKAGLDDTRRRIGFDEVAFGDLFLEDIRRYREERLHAWGYRTRFPLWQLDTESLAGEMIEAGLRAVLTCVDPQQCPENFAGRDFDDRLIAELPVSVDRCGENGEFHTLAYDGPMFARPIRVRVGSRVEREGFVFADVAALDLAAANAS